MTPSWRRSVEVSGPKPHLVLVGMMGSGKTSVGELLARRLGRPFLDSDRQVEERAGRSVAELWAAGGEAAFRDLESEVLAQALGPDTPVVVAAAGGVVLDPANRRLLGERAWVVWLRARPETLAQRLGTGAGRPLLADDPPGALRRLEAVRRPLYEEVADAVVDVDCLSPEAVVARIVELV